MIKRIILFPGLSGTATEVAPLQAALRPHHAVQVIQYPDWPALRTMGKTAFLAACRAQIGSFDDVAFFGYSFGGLVALALVIEDLERDRRAATPVIGLLDTPATPRYRQPPPAPFPVRLIRALRERVWADRLRYRLAQAMIRWEWPLAWAARWLRQSELSLTLQCSLTWPILEALQDRMDAIHAPLPIRAVLFRCIEQPSEVPADLGWNALIQQVRVIPIPGDHLAITHPAYAPILAARIAASDWLRPPACVAT